jgi:hypothetical protein
LCQGMKMYIDDKRNPVGSPGHAEHVVKLAVATCSRQQLQLKLGPGNTEITSVGFRQKKPIACLGGRVEYVAEHKSVGIMDADKPHAQGQLAMILSKGRSVVVRIVACCVSMDLPMAILLAAMDVRMFPSATFGAELTVLNTSAEKLLNRFQAWTLRKMLLVGAAIPRIVLMNEPRAMVRLGTQVWRRTIMTSERALILPQYSNEKAILAEAAKEPGSWAAAVDDKCAAAGIAAPPWRKKNSPVPSKYMLRRYSRETVMVSLRAAEYREWRNTRKQKEYWSRWSNTAWTVRELATAPVSIRALRAWVQLKLQGRLAGPAGTSEGPVATCRGCLTQVPETVEHLILECPRMDFELRQAREKWSALGTVVESRDECLQLLRHGGPKYEVAVESVRLAAAIARIVGHVPRRRRSRQSESEEERTASPSSGSLTE